MMPLEIRSHFHMPKGNYIMRRKPKMESKSRRLPFMSSSSTSPLSPSSPFPSSSSLGSSRLYGRSSVLGSDRYTRGSSIKLDSDHQSSRFQSSSRDYSIPESRHSSWKLSAPLTTSSVSCDRSWADSSVGSRSKMVVYFFNCQSESERRLGTYSGLLSTTQDGDSKRPKLSYANRASYSRAPSSSVIGSTSSSIGSVSDSSWKSYSPLARSSSSSSDGLRSRREVEDRSESSISGHRSSGLSSLYCSDRLTSSYAQGARPKESLYSSSRLNGSLSHHSLVNKDYQSPSLCRDSCRSTSRALSSASQRAQESPASSTGSESRGGSSRSCSWFVPMSERSGGSTPPAPLRQATESGDSDGRRTTRQLLSRLANSMSSTLFSRRSSQDSSGSGSGSSPVSRSFESSDDSSDVRREESSSASADSSRNSSPDGSERRGGAESSQGFAFLRRRRQGLSPVLEAQNPEPSTDPGRASGAWLSSSLRSRCPPLFSRRRREGRDETAHMATVSEDACRGSQLLLGSRGAMEAKATDDGDEDDDDDEEEDDDETEGAGAAGPSGATASVQDAPQAARHHRLSGVASNSRFRLSVPQALENSLPENVMITVDIMTSGRAADRQEKEKQTSSRDPEKLRKIQESLLLEESDEEEGDLCRICQMREESPSNPLLEPCRCTGSLQYVHQDCMKKWLRSKISSGKSPSPPPPPAQPKTLGLRGPDPALTEEPNALIRASSEYEFISCGLYLVVLLHLCEQRFSDVLGAANGFFNLARTLHEHMDDLESSYGESEEEVVQDNRPSIDFCDLEDEESEEY
ncbi:hypothetical protein JZ751_027671 [Albula glossodonta]|uniref:RING-type E3 ubiquitin transferase n=1 Tax=Albula glossodonta TaxID=121402 RepID=A0A8T2PID5_9TELE|nr:hypothetical protein JZ751_027671 [Albula glossodonta]